MNLPALRQSFWIAVLAIAGLSCTPAAFGGDTVIGTAHYDYTGRTSTQSYSVPSGANCVAIQAWGATGYVAASYVVKAGNSVSVTLSSSSGGSTKVQTSAGTITIAGSTCSASGSPYNLTTDGNYTTGGGPASPGAGKSYPGYVTITAYDSTYTLTITASTASAGTASGAGTYAVGTVVNISESAWNGYVATGWGGPDELTVASPNSAVTTITMNGDRNIVANFTPNVPTFSSSNATQTLVVGKTISPFQVSATQSPVFSASSLPPGLAISSSGSITGTPTTAGFYDATITASNDGVSIEEQGVTSANEIVTISSSTLGNNLEVYAGGLDVGVDGTTTTGFCIDPWHSSAEDQWLNYEWEALNDGPKMADGMGTTVALEIEQLWDKYYSSNMSDSTAAGLQIAIWNLVTASITAQTNGAYTYSLDSSNDYGASAMIAWVEDNPDATAANLYAVSGNGQDYVVSAGSLPQPIVAAASSTQLLAFMVYPQPTVASASATIPVGQSYVYGISATGSPTSFSASPLAPGLSVDTTSGVISGTPTTTGSYVVALTAGNPGASGTGTLTLHVVQSFTLSISTSPNNSDGTATGAGTYMAGTTVSIQETPISGFSATGWTGPNASAVASASSASTSVTMNGNYSLVANFGPITPVIAGGLPPIMLVGQAITANVTATPASTLTVANLPPGLSWNSGAIGSAPTQVGNYTATVTANNNGAIATENTSTAVYPTLSLPTASVTTGVDQPFSYSVGVPAWGSTLSATGLPAGLAFDPTSGVISGTPTATGTYTIALGEQNPATSASGSLTLTVTSVYTLTIESATGGAATGAGTYDAGTTVTVSETSAAHYRTNGWGGPNSGSLASPTSSSTTIVMNGNYTVAPQFVQQGTLTIASATGGTATGGGTFDVGSVQPIAAAPSVDYYFTAWSGANIASTGAAATTITITGDETITPAFLGIPNATIAAPATAYDLSPVTVTSVATAPSDNLALHSIEWMAPDGSTWSVIVNPASGGQDNFSTGITFPATGVYTVRAGVTTDGATWYYSGSQQIDVVNADENFTFESMAVPAANMTNWYNVSPVAEKTYIVQHVNQ
ncbi:MAG: beta strand repeat-containing protein [Opitutaceae bacterium]